MDLRSGPHFPLAQAFEWAGWKIVQPIDILIDREFDLVKPSVQKAINAVLPHCHLVSAAIDCSTKSRIREIKLPQTNAPKPLRTEKFPWGLPTLTGASKDWVEKDNRVSDYLLAIQHVINLHERNSFRENPRRSLHWA